ncbi:hypothetical protein [Tunturibacter empetritectus]|uniref:Uncharacterized protein n=1 Tax=Tunturiibacter empetritectus TaxID=3069691 RepID=A0A7W8IJ64_9BACT|nr:hypothetical protein [Edaphobacter lichenicola]MBB5318049.1 hypothetical protein [Edaphobacter lichenicola]
MTRKGKYVLYGAVAVILLAVLPFLAILPFAASNAVAAGYYLVFTRLPSLGELNGSYSAKPTWGTASLVINRDGSFEQSVSETGTTPKTLQGRWSEQNADGGHAIAVTLSPYINVQEDQPRDTYKSYTVNFYKRKFGTTFGVLNDDTGLQYTKIHD